MGLRFVSFCFAALTVAQVALADGNYPIPTTGQESQRFIPQRLVELALRRASRYHGKQHTWYLYAYLDAYRDYLLVRGQAYCGGTLESQRAGFQQGITDARDGSTAVTPEDFGYARAQIEGRFIFKFEGSRFNPIGTKGWESAFAFRFGPDVSRDEFVEGQSYLVNVWLSPEGSRGWGHMGMYKREIVVLSVVPGENESASDAAS